MKAALIYQARSRWLIWVSFGCAVAIHLAAVAIAESKSRPVSPDVGSFQPDVIAIDDGPAPQDPETVSPQEQVPTVSDDDAFRQENPTPPPTRPHKRTLVTPVIRSTGVGTGRALHTGSVKALTLYAPRPNYPYEARRGGITGSGIAELTVNPAVGNVIAARMAQSTGSVVLDNATVETLGRWRFKEGVVSNIDVPITYTLTGASY